MYIRIAAHDTFYLGQKEKHKILLLAGSLAFHLVVLFAVSVAVALLQEGRLKCPVDKESSKTNTKTWESSLESVESRERSGISPCFTASLLAPAMLVPPLQDSRSSPWISCPPFVRCSSVGKGLDVEPRGVRWRHST